MIKSYAYDVEILPNFFSVTFIDLNDYLAKFADCNNGKKAIPIIQKYTVKETIAKLNEVKCYKFYITDTDDSMLLSMLSFINQCMPHYDKNNVPIRTDIFGYNSSRYDKLMIAGLLMYSNNTDNTKDLITKLYELSKHIISLQDDKDMAKRDYLLSTLHKFKLPYTDIDVMTIFALNKVGKGTDAKGNTIYFGKSLKQTSINLQWYELLEHELPPISDIDIDYYHKIDKYRGIPADKLNKLIDKWDRYMIPEWIESVLHYNTNDVFIVCEMIRLNIDEVRLRYNISKAYGVDVLSSSRSNIADKLFVKFYSEFSGLAESQWRGKKTERKALAFKRVIFDFIHFETEPLKQLLADMKKVVIYSIGKDAFLREIKLGNLTYTIATGGLHSQDIPRELRSKIKLNVPSTGNCEWSNMSNDSYVYVHWDIASFYPSIMDVYRIAPKHINEGCFVRLIHWLKETRVQAKHSKDAIIDGIPKDVLAQVLKIVINSIYGKLGFENGDICDRLAVLKVTINGQLMIMMLCERLELAGIEVMSANTDGIVVKLYKSKKDKFEQISEEWKKETGLDADAEEYDCYINRDINNYIIKELNGKVSYKGAMNPMMYAVSLDKGYNMPIVAQAVSNYFLENKPVMETLQEANNILDFCATQNVGKQFHVEFSDKGKTNQMQANVRYYVSNNGGNIEKVRNDSGRRSGLCAGQRVVVLNTLDDKPIYLRDIKYNYYYNEALKLIDPIKLNISPNAKGNNKNGTKSGKALIKKYSGSYNSLFEDAEE